jgi:hypothetical protein
MLARLADDQGKSLRPIALIFVPIQPLLLPFAFPDFAGQVCLLIFLGLVMPVQPLLLARGG